MTILICRGYIMSVILTSLLLVIALPTSIQAQPGPSSERSSGVAHDYFNIASEFSLNGSAKVLAPRSTSAAAPYCPVTYYCAYDGVDFVGRPCGWTNSSSNYNVSNSCHTITGVPNGSANDMISSYQNWGSSVYRCIRSFQNANYGYELWFSPSEYTLPGNGIEPWVGSGANDKASSHIWTTC